MPLTCGYAFRGGFWAAAVRYVSVRGEPAARGRTDGHGRRDHEALTWHFRLLTAFFSAGPGGMSRGLRRGVGVSRLALAGAEAEDAGGHVVFLADGDQAGAV